MRPLATMTSRERLMRIADYRMSGYSERVEKTRQRRYERAETRRLGDEAVRRERGE